MIGLLGASLLAAAAVAAPASAPEPARASDVDVDALLERVARRYAALDRYDVTVRVTVQAAAGDAPRPVLSGRTERRGPVTLQELAGFVVLSRPELRVVADRAARTLHVNAEVTAAAVEPARLDPAAALRAARAGGHAVEARTRGDEVDVSFRPPDARPTVELTFRGPEPELRRMRIVRAPGAADGPAVVEVEYRWQDPRAAPADRFEAAAFVVRRGQRWEPSAAFAGYRVVDAHAR